MPSLWSGHRDAGSPWLIVQQGSLPEEVRSGAHRVSTQLCDLFTVDRHRDLTIIEDVEGVSVVALPPKARKG